MAHRHSRLSSWSRMKSFKICNLCFRFELNTLKNSTSIWVCGFWWSPWFDVFLVICGTTFWFVLYSKVYVILYCFLHCSVGGAGCTVQLWIFFSPLQLAFWKTHPPRSLSSSSINLSNFCDDSKHYSIGFGIIEFSRHHVHYEYIIVGTSPFIKGEVWY